MLVEIQGDTLRFSKDFFEAKSPIPKGGIRGKVRTFSYQSQRRFVSLLATIDFARMKKLYGCPSWVTLTYDGQGTGQEDSKQALDYLLSKVLPRKGFNGPKIWKAELQDRGVIHFHILMWHRKPRRKLSFLKSEWHRLTGSTQGAHLVFGVDIKKVNSVRALKCYLAKYLSKHVTKVDPDGVETGGTENWPGGRVWGVREKSQLAFYPVESRDLPLRLLPVVKSARQLGIQVPPFIFDYREWIEYVESMIGRKLQNRITYYRWRKWQFDLYKKAVALVFVASFSGSKTDGAICQAA